MKAIRLLIFFAVLTFVLQGQSQFHYVYPGQTGYYSPTIAKQTSDGGYIMLAVQSIGGVPNYLWKTDAMGNVQWSAQYSQAGNTTTGLDVIQTSDGGYMICGTTFVTGRSNEIYLLKVTSTGVLSWLNTYGTTNSDGLITVDGGCGTTSRKNTVQQTSDGGYIVAACTVAGTNHDGFVFKTDASGNLTWSNSYRKSATSQDYCLGIQQTTDGGYIVLMAGFDAGANGFSVVKLTSLGAITWFNHYTVNGVSTCNPRGGNIRQTTDGGYVLTAVNIFPRTPYIMKLDASGNVSWFKGYDTGPDDGPMYVIQTPDGGYLHAARGTDTDWRTMLIKTDASGNLQWANYYKQLTQAWSDQVQNTADGGYIMTGVQRTAPVGAYVVKMNSAGLADPSGTCQLAINPAVSNLTFNTLSTGLSSALAIVVGVPANTTSSPVITPTDICIFNLPIEGLELKTECEGSEVKITWTMNNVKPQDVYSIQRSMNSTDFETIKTYGEGEVRNFTSYQYSDDSFLDNNTVYYRIKRKDGNGAVEYSDLSAVSADGNCHPSPFSIQYQNSVMKIKSERGGPVRIYNSLGENVSTVLLEEGNAPEEIDTSAWPSGIYFVVLERSNGGVKKIWVN